MSIEIWLAFAIASAVLLIIPGPTILTVISYSISHGYKAKNTACYRSCSWRFNRFSVVFAWFGRTVG